MRKISLSVIAIAFAAACNDSPGDPTVSLALTVSVSASTISSTSPATVVTRVTNTGRDAQTVEGNQCGRTFKVLDAVGAEVGPLSVGACALNSIPIVLDPGEHYDWVSQWDGRTFIGGYVPGTYSVVGALLGNWLPASAAVKVLVQ